MQHMDNIYVYIIKKGCVIVKISKINGMERRRERRASLGGNKMSNFQGLKSPSSGQ